MPPIPPVTWVRFATGVAASPSRASAKVDRYRIDSVQALRGAPLSDFAAGQELVRVESTEALPAGEGNLIGVLSHLGYTRGGPSARSLPRPRCPVPTSSWC